MSKNIKALLSQTASKEQKIVLLEEAFDHREKTLKELTHKKNEHIHDKTKELMKNCKECFTEVVQDKNGDNITKIGTKLDFEQFRKQYKFNSYKTNIRVSA